MISLREVSKRFPGSRRLAVTDLSLDVAEGDTAARPAEVSSSATASNELRSPRGGGSGSIPRPTGASSPSCQSSYR